VKKAGDSPEREPVPGMKVGEDVALRQARLRQIGRVKAELEAREQARYEAELQEYDAKLAKRQEREQKSGNKLGGKAPKHRNLDREIATR